MFEFTKAKFTHRWFSGRVDLFGFAQNLVSTWIERNFLHLCNLVSVRFISEKNFHIKLRRIREKNRRERLRVSHNEIFSWACRNISISKLDTHASNGDKPCILSRERGHGFGYYLFINRKRFSRA